MFIFDVERMAAANNNKCMNLKKSKNKSKEKGN
jgi:hypothetical protein